jgi:ABC-type uncharacterized transport system permease subunit
VAFALSRLPRHAARERPLSLLAFLLCLIAIVAHTRVLLAFLLPTGGGVLTLSSAISLIGLQSGLIGLLGAIEPRLRGVSAGLLLLAALTAFALVPTDVVSGATYDWQIRAHILTSMFAYGLLTVGAIVAVYALVQDRRLHKGRLTASNHLFAPMETTEQLLYAVTAAGFTVLLLSVVSGVTFIENLFAQHLVHKTVLSLLALVMFGVLLGGRYFAGWRGKRAVYLYLAGFIFLGLAYFGSRVVLEELLGRSWS